jgi:hypothetical protein
VLDCRTARHSSTATGKSIPLSPLGSRDWLGLRQRRARAAVGFPGRQDRPARHLHARRRLLAPTRSRVRPAAREPWLPEPTRDGPARTGRVVRQPLRTSSASGQRHALLQGEFVEEDRRFFRIEERRRARGGVSDYDIQTGTQRAQLGWSPTWPTSSPRPPVSFENFYTHSGATRGGSSRPRTPRTTSLPQLPAAVRRGGLLTNAVSGEHFSRARQQPHRLAGELARATRDEPDLRETLYQAPLGGPALPAGRRVAERLPDVQHARRRHGGRRGELERLPHGSAAGRRQLQVRPSVRRPDARLPVAALPLHPDHAPGQRRAGRLLHPLRPSRSTRRQNIGTLFRFNEETGRPTPTTASRETTPATAWPTGAVEPGPARRRRARRAVRPGGQHVRSRSASSAQIRPSSRTPTCFRA